jgi:hypothetical protein
VGLAAVVMVAPVAEGWDSMQKVAEEKVAATLAGEAL